MKENKNLKLISQIGLVVEDLTMAEEGMRQVFGVEPDGHGITPSNNKFYYEKEEDFAAKMAFYHFANIDIELIEPQYGRNIWDDFLKQGKRGLHHVQFNVDSFDETVSDMKERNIEVSMQGESVRKIPGLKWAYFDTESSLGWVVEIFNASQILGNKGKDEKE